MHLQDGADSFLPSFPTELTCTGWCGQQVGPWDSCGVVLLRRAQAELAWEIPGFLHLCTLVQLWASHQQHRNKTMCLVQRSCGALYGSGEMQWKYLPFC